MGASDFAGGAELTSNQDGPSCKQCEIDLIERHQHSFA